MKSLKAVLLNLYKRPTKYDAKLGIIENGEDNLYPERVDRFVNNSVTARSCARKMVNYLVGKGFEDDELKLGKSDLTMISRKIANNIVKHYGVYINVHYNANFKPSGVSILPYAEMRKGKKDDDDYNGKFAYYKNWGEKKVEKEKIKLFDTFNPDPKIVEAQIMATKGESLAEKVKNYNGQVWYVNLTDDYEYSIALIDPVMFDCDSEAQSSTYKNKSLRRGFFGKTMVFTRPLAGPLEEYPNEVEYANAVSERDNFKEIIESMLGAENTGDAVHVEMELEDGETFDNAINVKDISSNVNDKMFEYTEKSVFQNILMAFNSVPPALIRPDNSVFSASGESIEAMKKEYMNNTEFERKALQKIINKLVKLINPQEYETRLDDYQLLPLIEDQENVNQ